MQVIEVGKWLVGMTLDPAQLNLSFPPDLAGRATM
jgi:hypothetical protein